MPNLNNVSRHDVEVALQALDIEDERERAAIRAFWRRERAGYKIHWGKVLVSVLWWAGCGLAGMWVLWVLANAALDWLWQGLGGR